MLGQAGRDHLLDRADFGLHYLPAATLYGCPTPHTASLNASPHKLHATAAAVLVCGTPSHNAIPTLGCTHFLPAVKTFASFCAFPCRRAPPTPARGRTNLVQCGCASRRNRLQFNHQLLTSTIPHCTFRLLHVFSGFDCLAFLRILTAHADTDARFRTRNHARRRIRCGGFNDRPACHGDACFMPRAATTGRHRLPRCASTHWHSSPHIPARFHANTLLPAYRWAPSGAGSRATHAHAFTTISSACLPTVRKRVLRAGLRYPSYLDLTHYAADGSVLRVRAL